MGTHGFETRAVHNGRHGLGTAHVPPIDLSTTNPLQDAEVGTASISALAQGAAEAENPIYARLYNPTVARFEQALADLEGLPEAVGFGSGMAAIAACLMAARERGGHVVAVRPVYGGTDHLLTDNPFGLTVTWAQAHEVGDAVRDDTALVIVETPANPTLALVDLAQVVRAAGRVPVMVDNTFATPVLQRPVLQGAKIVVHSATKFIGGHGDVVAGV
ncbi:MAG: aminotransferase class I/II-fold pyridoxal phosphate-dependent enzyme, partial [Myxococcales bacterium]|nr:aminotransferase class I/II-fold pyridoxal phosphate-dependent enzyme [Myxococcales bacterium]